MHFSTTTFAVAVSALASLASAANFSVTVGKDGTNIFDPTNLTGVEAGDSISFRFVSKNHTVTQSTFTAPCIAKENGVNSGFVPVAAGAATFPEWTIQVDNVTAPLWFYCAQARHCQAGMVFAINPTADKTFDTFLATAKGATAPANPSNSGTPSAGAGTTPTTGPGSTTPSGNATPSAPASGSFTLSVHKVPTLLAALGLVAGLSL